MLRQRLGLRKLQAGLLRKQVLETSHQFCGIERFAHIGVCTVFQAANNIVLIGKATQDDHWQSLAIAAQVGAQGASIAVWETYVEQYEIEVGGRYC